MKPVVAGAERAAWWRRGTRPDAAPPAAADLPAAVTAAPHAGSLLEGALRADDRLTVVWDAAGLVVAQHAPEPALLAEGSVTAERLGRALREAMSEALAGSRTDEQVAIYGPPRRELVVMGRPIRSDPYDPASAVIGAVARVEDVSAERRLEEVRRDFVANISHELRTPVGALGVLAEMIVGETNPKTTARLAARMDAEAARLARMVDELLALARLEAGGDASAERFDVRQAIDGAMERLGATAEKRHISIVVSATPAVVQGDPGQLVSAVHNLLDNAVKHSDDGRTVTVRVTPQPDKGTVDIAVVDEGVGIPLADRERIFERFYRVDRARTGGTGGIGLGLAIVRHVAVNLGGHVQVQSIEGQGSTFTLTLPLAGPPEVRG